MLVQGFVFVAKMLVAFGRWSVVVVLFGPQCELFLCERDSIRVPKCRLMVTVWYGMVAGLPFKSLKSFQGYHGVLAVSDSQG